jgi:hypothetical protein
MGRETDFGDKSIRKGFGPDKDKKLKVKDGEELIVRVATKLKEYMSHSVHDVLPKKPDGTPGVFNMNCAQKWDEKAEEYVGPCLGHDADYDLNTRYVCGAFVLAKKQGKSIFPLAPSDSPKFWDMAAGRVRELQKVVEDAFSDVEPAQIGEKLRSMLLKLSLKDEGGAEDYQKLDIKKWEGDKIPLSDQHKATFKAEIPAIIEEIAAPADIKEQERRLKPKKGKPGSGGSPEKGATTQEDKDELADLDLDGDGGEAPKPAAKPAAAKKVAATPRKKAEPEPEAEEASEAADDLDLGEEEPAKPAAKKTAVAASTAPKAGAKKSSGDAEVDDMLDGLEGD